MIYTPILNFAQQKVTYEMIRKRHNRHILRQRNLIGLNVYHVRHHFIYHFICLTGHYSR